MKIKTNPLAASFDKVKLVPFFVEFCYWFRLSCSPRVALNSWSSCNCFPNTGSIGVLLPPGLAQYEFFDVNFQVIIITVRFPWNTQFCWIAGLKFFTIIANQNATVAREKAAIWRVNAINRILQQTFHCFSTAGKNYWRQIRRWGRWCYSKGGKISSLHWHFKLYSLIEITVIIRFWTSVNIFLPENT